MLKIKIIINLGTIAILRVNIEWEHIEYLRFNEPNEIPVVFYNGSNYDYHFTIKELVIEFKGQFECLGKILKREKLFSFPTEKETRKVDKDENEGIMKISHK